MNIARYTQIHADIQRYMQTHTDTHRHTQIHTNMSRNGKIAIGRDRNIIFLALFHNMSLPCSRNANALLFRP